MNRLLKFICSGAVMLTAASGIFADTNEVSQSSQSNQSGQNKPRGKQQPPPFEQGMGLSATNMPVNKYQPAYNAPACIDIKGGWDVDLFGSFIYWHVSQEDMDVAFTVLGVPSGQLPAVAYQKFKYKPGFKAGIGLDLNYDGWVAWAEYTWLHQTVNNTAAVPAIVSPAASGVWSSNHWFTNALTGAAGTSVRSKWKMNMDMVDAVFSRPYYEGMKLTVSPYAGMRALWLRQHMHITFLPTPTTNAMLSTRSNSWALGPVGGVLGHWMLGAGFRFEGNSALSILYTRYTKISHKETTTSGLPIPFSASTRNFNALRPAAQIGVGLGWGSYFADNGYYVDLSARYDFLYFWDQNVMRQYAENISGRVSPAGDLEMHGLTATLRFDF